MGVSSLEEPKPTTCLSPKIYQPSDMDPSTGSPKKRKMFSSSSFYAEPQCLYPTMEEQVELCRRIAQSLSDACNLRSKGADMFFKRVQRADQWIVPEGCSEGGPAPSDPSELPYVRPSCEAPRLKLLLAPRPLVDLERLRKEGVEIVEHTAVSPEVCQDIVRDLNSPTDKGGKLFGRRKAKSEEWVVDEEKVRQLMHARYPASVPAPDEQQPARHPRVVELSGGCVAEAVLAAAEAKIMRYPNAVPQVPVIRSLDDGVPEAYRVRTPKGWDRTDASASPAASESPSGLRRAHSFHNFNGSPRAWNADVPAQFRPATIRSVRPPSLLLPTVRAN